MDKAPDAYRTISEVGEDLDIAQHVLRFWETRFPQIKPLKRGGGRRYYRPDDVELLKGIRHLLYREGYTIKGVQRILREQGLKDVMAVGRSGSLAALATEPEPEPDRTLNVAEVPVVRAPSPVVESPKPQPPTTRVEPAFYQTAQIERVIAPKKSATVETAMPLLDAMMPPVPPELAAQPSQVSMFRGGLQRGQEMPTPTISDAVMPDKDVAERKSRLRHALAELEACKAILAEYQRRAC